LLISRPALFPARRKPLVQSGVTICDTLPHCDRQATEWVYEGK
jgi:hypothetical protein